MSDEAGTLLLPPEAETPHEEWSDEERFKAVKHVVNARRKANLQHDVGLLADAIAALLDDNPHRARYALQQITANREARDVMDYLHDLIEHPGWFLSKSHLDDDDEG